MKTAYLFTLIFCLSFFGHAQNDSSTIFSKRHEVKIGMVKLLVAPILEGTYEYIPDRNIGYGASLLFNFNTSNDYFEDFSLTPFFRMYFQKDEQFGAKGFFVEAFTAFYTGKEDVDTLTGSNSNTTNSFFETAFGFSFGKKWINFKGFVFEAKLGIGRNLLGNTSFGVIGKGDLYVGYRF